MECIESWSSDVRPSSTRSIAWRRMAVDVSSKRASDVASSWGTLWSKDKTGAEAEDVEDMMVGGKSSVTPPGQRRRQVNARTPRGPARGSHSRANMSKTGKCIQRMRDVDMGWIAVGHDGTYMEAESYMRLGLWGCSSAQFRTAHTYISSPNSKRGCGGSSRTAPMIVKTKVRDRKTREKIQPSSSSWMKLKISQLGRLMLVKREAAD